MLKCFNDRRDGRNSEDIALVVFIFHPFLLGVLVAVLGGVLFSRGSRSLVAVCTCIVIPLSRPVSYPLFRFWKISPLSREPGLFFISTFSTSKIKKPFHSLALYSFPLFCLMS